MTGQNPVQDRIDALEASHEAALDLLERSLHLAARQCDRGLPPARLATTVRLAVAFYRRAGTAGTELTDFINYLERDAS